MSEILDAAVVLTVGLGELDTSELETAAVFALRLRAVEFLPMALPCGNSVDADCGIVQGPPRAEIEERFPLLLDDDDMDDRGLGLNNSTHGNGDSECS